VELAITPDRGYCFSIRGIARELAHSLKRPFRDPAGQASGASEVLAGHAGTATGQPAYPLSVEDRVGCDRFAGRVVRDIDPDASSPAWMRRRLEIAGIRSISLPVDITNYLMLELGQPMHAWDLDRLSGPLVVRRARPGEKLVTLDGVHRSLHPEDLVI